MRGDAVPGGAERAPIGLGPMGRRLLDWWTARRPPGGLPARAAIDPADLGPVLPHVVLLRWEGGEVVHALVGTAVVARMGIEPTGRPLGDIASADHVGAIRGNLRLCTDRPCGMVTDHWIAMQGGVRERTATLVLPYLQGDGGEVRLICVSDVLERRHDGAGGGVALSSGEAKAFVDLGFGVPDRPLFPGDPG
jgi:hypothetical protein